MRHSSRLSLSVTSTTKAARRPQHRTKITGTTTITASNVERGCFPHNHGALITFLLLWTMILFVHESIAARVIAFCHHYNPTLSIDTPRRLRRYVYHRWMGCCGYYSNRHYHHHTLGMIRTEPFVAATTTWIPHRNIASTTTRSVAPTISSSVRLYSSTSSEATTSIHIDSVNNTHSGPRSTEFSTNSDDDNWVQWIYDAYREHETDGIIQLGTSSDSTDKDDDTVATIMLPVEARKNPMDHLSASELWRMTLVAARRIALDNTKQVSRKVSHDDGRFVPGTGIAASMLNGWIAAIADRCSVNGGHHNSLQQQQQYRIHFAQDLFRIATVGHDAITGRTVATGKTQSTPPTTRNNPSKPDKNNEKKNVTTLIVVEPDLVTYSLLYTLLHPTNPILAESYLQLAQRQSKKSAGTQRRKLLSKTSSFRPEDGAATFRHYENELQALLSPTENTTTIVDGDNDSNDVNIPKEDALILHENENYIVINKPSGTCCYYTHTTTAGKRNVDLSLVDALQKFRSSANNHQTSLSTLNPVALGIVHRLDRGTSGCMVIAKNDPTHARFVAAMFQRQFQKTYTVLVSPAPCIESYHETTGYITIPVDGKPAKSKYTVIERFVRYNNVSNTNDTAALMNVTTYTGRQHQVRVHCSYGLKSPIIGDTLYAAAIDDSKIRTAIQHRTNRKDVSRVQNDKSKERFHLHASTITIPDHDQWSWTAPVGTPTRATTRPIATMTYDAPIPTWWKPVLDSWRHTL